MLVGTVGLKSSRRTLTSIIILQLLHGPICWNSSRISGSVTSLHRFPTYLRSHGNKSDSVFVKQEVSEQTKAS